ncbi:hypothetical protein AKO1_007758, partial [Acrasis kona]
KTNVELESTEQEASRVCSVLSKICKWSELQCYGSPLGSSFLIPHKTPIDQKYINPTWHPFTISSFIQDQEDAGRVVGCIIDLTNHERIYNVDDLEVPMDPLKHRKDCGKAGCKCPKMPLQHIHIRCISKEYPEAETIERFSNEVKRFRRSNPNHYIGVHCSYGFNRTGFVVCSYLVESSQMRIEEAVNAFKASRQPGIKHQNFVEELTRRYKVCSGLKKDLYHSFELYNTCNTNYTQTQDNVSQICIN